MRGGWCSRGMAFTVLLSISGGACSDPSEPEGVVGQIVVAPEGLTVEVGQSVQIGATGYADGALYAVGDVTWTSSDPSIARIESSGVVDLLGTQHVAVVVGVSVGTVEVTATSERAGEGSVDLTVVAAAPTTGSP
jgi:uncharacterized protein YjdB